jgi:signal transduction histidine kinase
MEDPKKIRPIDILIDQYLDRPDIDLNTVREEMKSQVFRVLEQIKEKEQLIKQVSIVNKKNLWLLVGELHDGPLQRLPAACRLFQVNTESVNEFEAYRVLVADFLAEITEIADSIRIILLASADGSSLSGLNVITTQLREIIRKQNNDAKIDFEISDESETLLADISGQLGKLILLFAEETIRNAIKHGQATKVLLKVYQDNGSLVLQTSDNGQGFKIDPPTTLQSMQDLADNGRLGLRFLAQFAAPYQGDFMIERNHPPLGGASIAMKLEILKD